MSEEIKIRRNGHVSGTDFSMSEEKIKKSWDGYFFSRRTQFQLIGGLVIPCIRRI